jgi:hypothetical protein
MTTRRTVVDVALAGALLVMPVLVLVQAALAGQWLAEADAGMRTAHGVVGNITFVVALAVTSAVWLRRHATATRVVATALLLLIVSQIGLGYSTRSSPELVAWHVPMGVAIFGLATYLVAVARSVLRGARPGT